MFLITKNDIQKDTIEERRFTTFIWAITWMHAEIMRIPGKITRSVTHNNNTGVGSVDIWDNEGNPLFTYHVEEVEDGV